MNNLQRKCKTEGYLTLVKQLKFEHKYAKDIVAGKKTATFRVNDDKDINIGDKVELVDKVDGDHPKTWKIRGQLRIISVNDVSIANLSQEHLLRAKSFENIEEMVQVFRRFYGEHIDENTLVRVLNFEFNVYSTARNYLPDEINAPMTQKAVLYVDGGSRGNPGPSALGFVVVDDHNLKVHSDNKYLGITTNNQAEYHALIAGLDWCNKHGVSELSVRLDSMLVVNQMTGKFKVKNRDLWSLFEKARELTKDFHRIHFTHVPRELNKMADAEVNKALDAIKGEDIVQ